MGQGLRENFSVWMGAVEDLVDLRMMIPIQVEPRLMVIFDIDGTIMVTQWVVAGELSWLAGGAIWMETICGTEIYGESSRLNWGLGVVGRIDIIGAASMAVKDD